ncbi:MAG: Ig-like domain-containing protein [Bacteroidales bacterium]|nr:Ig-like domain-containing protein [Bacteroidales bacterium]
MIKKIFAVALMIVALSACRKTPEDTIVPVASVAISQTEAEMELGETVQLKVQVTPSNATQQSVMWASSKKSVATVSDTGEVTAVGEGSATITATAGGKSASCRITVLKPKVEVQSLELDQKEVALPKGASLTLVATVSPADASDATVFWSSADEAVAIVDQSGKITATGRGSTVVTAFSGNKSASCKVSVNVPVERISLSFFKVEIPVGGSIHIIAYVEPADADDTSVVWASTDTEVIEVDQDGLVSGKRVGEATVSASSADGSIVVGCVVTVTPVPVPVESVSLDRTDAQLEIGQTLTLTATVLPEDATSKSVRWASSNPGIAEVDQAGNVTAKGAGTATITATTVDGGKVAGCEVLVKEPFVEVVSVAITDGSTTVGTIEATKGTTRTLYALVLPENASQKTVTWTSSNPDVVIVDQTGAVAFVGGGEAVVTAEAGGKTAACRVSVTAPVTSIVLNATELEMTLEETFTLVATVYPEDATNKDVQWTSSDAAVVSVQGGVLTARATGTATITATAKDGSGVKAECRLTVVAPGAIDPARKVIEAIDLGLSVKWGSVNLGTSRPDEYGDSYYSWGETEIDDLYYWEDYTKFGTYDYKNTSTYGFTKYNGLDGKSVLDPEDDVAHVKLGGKWRMPTIEEFRELLYTSSLCRAQYQGQDPSARDYSGPDFDWKWYDNYNGSNVAGFLVTAPNGNSIFLPAAGFKFNDGLLDVQGVSGVYWSSSCRSDIREIAAYQSWYVYFRRDGLAEQFHWTWYGRYAGHSIRPVSD